MPLSLLLKIFNDNLVNICVINFLLQTSFLVPKKVTLKLNFSKVLYMAVTVILPNLIGQSPQLMSVS